MVTINGSNSLYNRVIFQIDNRWLDIDNRQEQIESKQYSESMIS